MGQERSSCSNVRWSMLKGIAVLILICPALLLPSRTQAEGYTGDGDSSIRQQHNISRAKQWMKLVQRGDWTIHYQLPEASYKLAKAEPKKGVYLGAYVLQDSAIQFSMKAFNERTGRQHASFFKYVGYGKPFPAEWVRQVKEAGAFPHIAWEPNKGLGKVQDDAYIHEFASQANEAGTPIFLRFASEMNGTWTAYSGDAEGYKRVWRMVHDIFAKEAPNVAMVWTVLTFPVSTIEHFYPGDCYVDWVGVNLYNVKYHNGNKRDDASHEDPRDLLNFVYNRFSRAKPIQLSEFGATHYNTTDGQEDTRFAINRISRLYRHLESDYPRVKAVYYFDVNNVAAYNKARQINDYSLTGNAELLQAYRSVTNSSHFLNQLAQYPSGYKQAVQQHFTYRGFIFKENGKLYVDELFFSQLLRLKVKVARDDSGVEYGRLLSRDGYPLTTTPITVVQRNIWTGLKTERQHHINRSIRALPLKQAITALGWKIDLQGKNIYIQE
ncbi:glycoside hydrolase family 26 protein [Paenibacillus sinopodophylli]|uniref:glycoside hydrolase family 26 protein n=1 Tax=Paenibacillus sinopodophylli TaxID=1837342 RepID=UPI00110C9BC3|nr:glycosyl hydrolase [Paenibacillus sinopodophylli]